MFDNLTTRLNKAFKNIKGQGRLTEENIQETTLQIKKAFIEADVALPVINKFIDTVKTRALGQDVSMALNPSQHFIKIIKEELTTILGSDSVEINLKTQPPAVILLAGLQGSGKTTTSAKLARYLSKKYKKKVMLASTDVYRPAAQEQLAVLATQLYMPCHIEPENKNPLDIAANALSMAKRTVIDILIVDTAGRMHVDTELMSEISSLHKLLSPIETLFVVDSMTGQDAANTAKTFSETLDLTGIILTKTDGDSRGGAALSTSTITGKPVKFIGTGEQIDAFERFHPDRMASRILGMGDMLSLIESADDNANQKQLAKKISKGKAFNFNDLREQLNQMNQIGGLEEIVKKLPGGNQISGQNIKGQGKEMNKSIAIINSMTIKERKFPKLLDASRKKRIARGSGTQVADINRLTKQLLTMQKMMKKFTKMGNMGKMMRNLPGPFKQNPR